MRRLALVLGLSVAMAAVLGTAMPGTAYVRPFSDASWFNLPIPATYTVDAKSATYIADLGKFGAPGYPKLVFTATFGQRVYHASASDTLYHLTQKNPSRSVDVRIPAGAKPNTGSDHEMVVFDDADGIVVGMHGAVCCWTVDSFDRYSEGSNGLHGSLPGSDDAGNTGHRGANSGDSFVAYQEVVDGAINHVLKVSIDETANSYFWPMVGSESGRCGPLNSVCTPEGSVIRIKPSVDVDSLGLSSGALVIAHAAQTYGFLIGDTGNTPMGLKLEYGPDWSAVGITATSLSKVPWSMWEFVQGGSRR